MSQRRKNAAAGSSDDSRGRLGRPAYSPPISYTYDESTGFDCFGKPKKPTKFREVVDTDVIFHMDGVKVYVLQTKIQDTERKEPRVTIYNALRNSQDVVNDITKHVPFKLLSYDEAAIIEIKQFKNAEDKMVRFGRGYSLMVDKTEYDQDLDCFVIYKDLKKNHVSIHAQYSTCQKLDWFRAIIIEFGKEADMEAFCNRFGTCCRVQLQNKSIEEELQEDLAREKEEKEQSRAKEIEEEVNKQAAKDATIHQGIVSSLIASYEKQLKDLKEANVKLSDDAKTTSRLVLSLTSDKVNLKRDKEDMYQQLLAARKEIEDIKKKETKNAEFQDKAEKNKK